MELLTLWPLVHQRVEGWWRKYPGRLFRQWFSQPFHPGPDFDLEGSIVAGGFPEPVQRSTHRRRQAWFESYITTILDRDIRNLAQIQDLAVLPRLLQLLAGRTATLYNQSEVSRSSGIRTAHSLDT